MYKRKNTHLGHLSKVFFVDDLLLECGASLGVCQWLPKTIVRDMATCLNSDEFKSFSMLNNIEHRHSFHVCIWIPKQNVYWLMPHRALMNKTEYL